MKIARRAAIVVVLAAVQALAPAQAAVARGQTARGEPWLAGGIGEDEVAALRLARSGYTLSVPDRRARHCPTTRCAFRPPPADMRA